MAFTVAGALRSAQREGGLYQPGRSLGRCESPAFSRPEDSHPARHPSVYLTLVHYVYLLVSARSRSRRYVGVTTDLKQRLAEHNSGKSPHTAQFKPWRLVTYVAFSDEQQAAEFERYLKSGSGHAFANRRLW